MSCRDRRSLRRSRRPASSSLTAPRSWLGRSRRAALLLCLYGFCLYGTATLPAQEIDGTRWGFDGRVVAEEFNLLTVFVSNPGTRPIDTDLVLARTDGIARRGAPLASRVYLAAGGRRVVQFQPFVVSAAESWELSWRGLAGTVPVPAIRQGAPALVWLADTAPDGIHLPHFPTRLLPVAAVSMATLGAVVMDTVPQDWLTAQRQAFLEWLQAGRVLHLLPVEGRHPHFGGELGSLDGEAPVFRVGQGLVVRHDFPRARLTESPLPTVLTGEPRTRPFWFENAGTGLVGALRSGLRDQTDRSTGTWALLLLGAVYAGLAGPGFWWLSRRRIGFGAWIGSLALLVAVATWVFTQFGRRSVEDADARHTLIFAEQVAGDRYLVTTHMGLHVVRGGEYDFSGGDAHTLFTSAQADESIRGEIRNGLPASYRVDIPGYSRRMIVRRRAAVGPGLHVTPADGRSLDIHGPPDICAVYGIRGDELLVFHPRGGPDRFAVIGTEPLWRWIGSGPGSDPYPGPGLGFPPALGSDSRDRDRYRYRHGYGYGFGADHPLEDVLRRRTASHLGMAGREPGSPATRSSGDTLVFVLCRGAPAAFRIDDVPAQQVRTTTIYSTYVHWK